MDPKRFVAPSFGRVVKTPGRFGFYAFVPSAIPRTIDFDADTVLTLSEADTALGRLAGAGRLLPNPHLLVDPYVVREAVASSRIEGTQASMSDVFQAEARGTAPAGSDVGEVQNYIRAMSAGLDQLRELPLCLRLIREIHAVLMTGVRGTEKLPGEFRSTPNWIGSADDRPETATFVPPPPDQMGNALDDWERFANEDVRLPVLVRAALLHYQFETIHPFLDGNGRLGRLLVVFFLVQQRRLPEPLLYVSAYLEQHRTEYYDRLQGVRERGELQQWLRFFLHAVAVQANDAVDRAERLADLREEFRGALAGSRSRARDVVETVFRNPVLTTRRVTAELGVTNQGALNLIRELEAREIVVSRGSSGRGGRQYWYAPRVYEILDGGLLGDPAAHDGATKS